MIIKIKLPFWVIPGMVIIRTKGPPKLIRETILSTCWRDNNNKSNNNAGFYFHVEKNK